MILLEYLNIFRVQLYYLIRGKFRERKISRFREFFNKSRNISLVTAPIREIKLSRNLLESSIREIKLSRNMFYFVTIFEI